MRITKHLRERIVERLPQAKGLDLFGTQTTAIANFLVNKAASATEVVTYLGDKGKESYLIITINGQEWGLGIDPAGKRATTLLKPSMLRRDKRGAKLYTRLPRRAA